MTMANWTSKKLKTITTKIGSGATPRGGKGAYHKKGMPLIRSLNIYDLNFTFDNLAFINDSQAEELDNVSIEKDDVLLNITGASVCRCTSVPDQLVPARVNQHVSIIRADKKNLLGRYLKYVLVSQPYKQALYGLATTGATREALTKNDIECFEIKVPDITTQSRIASVLSAYDDLIENNEKRIKTLEEMAQLLYTEWFVKFKFPGHEKVKMVESGTEYGLVPEGWEVKRLSDIANDKRDQVHPSQIKPNTPYVGLEHIPRKTITLTNWGTAVEVQSGKLSFQTGNILFGKIRPYFHKVVSAPINGITSTDTIVIVTKNERYNAFALMCVSSENFVSYATKTSQGTKMPRADWKTLMKYPVVVPPDILLRPFNALINDSITEMKTLMIRNRKLIELRNLLIPELVTGKRELK